MPRSITHIEPATRPLLAEEQHMHTLLQQKVDALEACRLLVAWDNPDTENYGPMIDQAIAHAKRALSAFKNTETWLAEAKRMLAEAAE